jgi:DNA adenine methylase
MVKYSCERCGKDFSQKSHYDSHNRRKTPCENNADKIKALVDKAVEEKLQELKKLQELNNKNLIVTNIVNTTDKKVNTTDKKVNTTDKKVNTTDKKVNTTDKKVNTTDKKMVKYKIQKPFLKWLGGKTQIINNIISKLPKEMNNYHELFLGGGSVLLAVLSLQKQNKIVIKNKIYAYDINGVLMNVYKHIQNNKDELYKFINLYIKEYDSIKGTIVNRKPVSIEEAKTSKESYYYWIRKKYNNIDKNTIECSALFMFINKTCFRGMYREGPNGYNVPYGHYKKTPTIISEADLNYISDLIKDVEFKHSSFSDSIKNVKEGDFVYLDPPYAPKNANSFVGYVAGGFNLETHKLLFSEIKKLGKIKFVMSNAKVELVTDNFKEYDCEDIIARRAINSKKPGSTTTEVIIYN